MFWGYNTIMMIETNNGGNEMIKKFEIGKSYENNFISNSDLYYSYTVISRTKAFVTFKENLSKENINKPEILRRKVINCVDAEMVRLENYSMAPILSADKEGTASGYKNQEKALEH